jgi:hypothetical protein
MFRTWKVRLLCSRSLLGGVHGRSGLLFSGGQSLNPLLLHKASSPVPQVYATFVSSHNAGELNPFLESAQVI